MLKIYIYQVGKINPGPFRVMKKIVVNDKDTPRF